MLLLVPDLVVYNPKTQAKDMLKEGLEPQIKVVDNNVQVVLDVQLHNLLAGLVVVCHILLELQKVLLEVVLLYVCAA